MTRQTLLLGGDDTPEKRATLAAALEQAGWTVATGSAPEKRSEEAIGVLIHTHGSAQAASAGAELLDREAGAALDGARLVNVLFHKVVPTGPSANAVCIDLVQWRGGQDNAHFQRLMATLRRIQEEAAELAGRQQSATGWITALWRRHKVGTLILALVSFFVIAFIQNLINAEIACSINFAQPTISDICGQLGLGDKPTRTERLAWKDVDRNNCAALQAHARRFPDGAFRSRAIDLYEAGRIETSVRWEPQTRETPLFQPEPEDGSPSQTLASDALMAVVAQKAKEQCAGYTAGNTHRVISASSKTTKTRCTQSGALYFCEFDGHAVCKLERRVEEQVRVCGGQ